MTNTKYEVDMESECRVFIQRIMSGKLDMMLMRISCLIETFIESFDKVERVASRKKYDIQASIR